MVSALLSENGKPAQAFRFALTYGEVLLSRDSLKELDEVLGRKKFARYITTERRREFLETLVKLAVLIEIIENISECRDPKDDQFLELAVNGNAQYIVSGDDDLLVLHPFRTVSIVKAEEFLRIVEFD